MEPVAQPPEGTTPTAPRQPPQRTRRAFLRAAAGAGLLLAGAAALARRPAPMPPATASASTAQPALPAVDSPLPPVPADPPPVAAGLSPWITPTADFYRIDIATEIPHLEPGSWSLTVDGLVDQPLTLTYSDLAAMKLVEVDATLSCVSNPIGGHSIGTARWAGVPLADVLALTGIDSAAQQVFTYGADGFTAGFPVEEAARTGVLIALGMNGEPLSAVHGRPARLVVPGLYGYVSATKWLERIELATWDSRTGYWMPRGWSKLGPVKTASRIDLPRQGGEVAAGAVTVAGMAWARGGPVSRVEVRGGDGPWLTATLGQATAENSWRQWWAQIDLQPGLAEITVRAYDATGALQTQDVADVAPDGATGWHSVVVDVA